MPFWVTSQPHFLIESYRVNPSIFVRTRLVRGSDHLGHESNYWIEIAIMM